MALKKPSDLSICKIGTLGVFYINAFELIPKGQARPSDLENVARELLRRPIEDRIEVYRTICSKLEACVKKEDRERAAIYRDMKNLFYKTLLG